jgi:hypothetical protein
MTKRQLERIHGHSIPELERLVHDACNLFEEEVSLERENLGGWSNINIRGHSLGIDFVLKLPWSISTHKTVSYKHLKDISMYFNKIGIAAFPLSMGQLSDTKNTPFIIFEYVKGVVHNSLTEFTAQELSSLKTCLQLLAQQKPPGLIRYKSPSDHLTAHYALVENHQGLSIVSQDVSELIDTFNDFYPEILSFTDSLGSWVPSIMHGDLWIPNIVLESGNITLLDFEACAYGNPHFDLAYLLETPVNTPVSEIPGLVRLEDVDGVNNLRPLVVAFLINWSLERLLSMESGLVEPNLDTPENRSALIDYTSSKMTRLKKLLC